MIVQKFNSIEAVFATDKCSEITSFVIVPEGMSEKISEDKLLCNTRLNYGKRAPESMLQVAFAGDSPSRDFSAGISYRNSETSLRMRVTGQDVIENSQGKEVVTYLKDNDGGIEAEHHLRQKKGQNAIECWNKVTNVSGKAKILEYLPSFSLSYLTPFENENDPDRIIMHRFRNYWSGECIKESLPVSHFAMEDSWSYYGYRMERFGQVGTMPARGFIPFVAMEDVQNGVVWAATIDAPASWQIEAGHRTCGLHMSGGLADYNFGHWRKILENGESFSTHSAFITAVKGGLLDACRTLSEYEWSRVDSPKCEEDLPIMYNEYLYTNGNPTMDTIKAQLPFCKECGVKYFVMDDGWFADPEKKNNYLGDWLVDKERFGNGLKEFSDYANANGMQSGIWYEFENVTDGADISKKLDLMHTRDGMVIRHQDRLFLDFRKKEVTDYLAERVIGEIKASNIGYLKIDYNENIGLGVDGAESLGEGLREHADKVVEFYRRIKKECPDLVIEICSSGGMRHEPLFVSLGSMVSFSDLHFNPEGAVVACNLHYIFHPRQLDIWSYIKTDFSEDRTVYAMVQGMLGRLCLSGDLAGCPSNIKQIIKDGTAFYDKIKWIIKDGKTISIDCENITSLCNIHSAFSLTRLSCDEEYALFYAFRVKGKEDKIVGKLPHGYGVVSQYGRGNVMVCDNEVVVYPTDTDEFATVVLLKKQ